MLLLWHRAALRAAAVAAMLSLAALGACARDFTGVVVHVTDGDTLWVRPATGGPPRQVRLLGIDAPEICQVHGTAARKALSRRLVGQTVEVHTDRRDDYRRWLGRVATHRDRDIGRWLVAHGHAWSYRFRGDRGPYAAEEARARQARRGLWAHAAPQEPRVFRRRYGACSPPASRNAAPS